ncbi:WW domain-binding protein 2-like [Rhipicephalus microplus]|uniref:WW domain-binding protein 2-like n=1 Tax=Rhipicephalus microplus TaxID=6941 RepID=UPI003F6B51F7
MSLNTSHAPGGVLVFTGELILLYSDDVEVTFEGPAAKKFQGAKKGRIYLTTHRVVFINKNSKDYLQSFSMPFVSMSNLGLEQPIFGANYIRGNVTAEENGNWTGKCSFKLKFMKGGAIEFGQAMMNASKFTQRAPNVVVVAHQMPAGPYQPLHPTAYLPGQTTNVGFFLPVNVFPQVPPANSVYTSNVPPPYPGVCPANEYPRMSPSNTSASGATGTAGGTAQPPPPGFKEPAAQESGHKEANEAPSAPAPKPGFKDPPRKDSQW